MPDCDDAVYASDSYLDYSWTHTGYKSYSHVLLTSLPLWCLVLSSTPLAQMPVLPFTISYNKGIRGKFKVPGKSRRHQNDSSFFQFTSSDIIDIHDKTVVTTQFDDFNEELVPKASLDSNSSAHTAREQPRMSFEPLDLHISPEPLISSFPPQFLKRSFIHPGDADKRAIQGSSSARLPSKGKETSNASSSRAPVEPTMGGEAFGAEDDDAKELIAKLQGMDVRLLFQIDDGI